MRCAVFAPVAALVHAQPFTIALAPCAVFCSLTD
jgi:hypothetical protein